MAYVSDSRSELLRAAEELSNFHDVATIGKRRYLERVRNHKLRSAVFGILFQQLCEYPLRLRSVLVKVVLLFLHEPVCSLPSGAQRRIESDVTKQVEEIGVRLTGGAGQIIEVDAPIG